MHSLLPDSKEIRVFQQLGRVTAKQLEPLDQLLLILPAKPTKADFGKLPQGAGMQAVYRKHAAGSTPAFTTRWAGISSITV